MTDRSDSTGRPPPWPDRSYPPVRHPENVAYLQRRRQEGTGFGIVWSACVRCGTLASGFDGSWHWWHVDRVDCDASVADMRAGTGPNPPERPASFSVFDEAGQAWHLLGHAGLLREFDLAVADLKIHHLAELVAAAIRAAERSSSETEQ